MNILFFVQSLLLNIMKNILMTHNNTSQYKEFNNNRTLNNTNQYKEFNNDNGTSMTTIVVVVDTGGYR